MQSEKLITAIQEYYKLKEKYENKYSQDKLKIIKNLTLSNKEKQQKFQQLKKVCIKCKKEGGTIFTNKDNKLKAVCGHIENPCTLNIDIDKGSYKTSFDLANILNETIDEQKLEIIKTKLDFLFGYISEETAVTNFNKLKSNLAKSTESYKNIEMKYLDIVDNKEHISLENTANIDLHKNILELKELYKNYKSTQNIAFIKTMVELYISDILKLAKEIRDLKYKVNYIEDNNNIKTLIQKKNPISLLEISLKEGKINFFRK